MPKAKQRTHNEWFQPLATRGRCPCGLMQDAGSRWAWGEYVSGRWRKVDEFCQACFANRILARLLEHAKPCGCAIILNGRSGYAVPEWLRGNIHDVALNLRRANATPQPGGGGVGGGGARAHQADVGHTDSV